MRRIRIVVVANTLDGMLDKHKLVSYLKIIKSYLKIHIPEPDY